MSYEKEAMSTLSNKFYLVTNHPQSDRTHKRVTINILHGALGVVTEAGEIADAVKKSCFYGKPLDYVNLAEEIGDCFWYLAILAQEVGIPFEQIMAQNLAKLRARYPEKFTEERALNRDLDQERTVLVKHTNNLDELFDDGLTHGN